MEIVGNGELDIMGEEVYICRCVCGNEFELGRVEYILGEVDNCGCLDLAEERKIGTGKLFSRYKGGAKKRKLEFRLTIGQFSQLTSGKCAYCGKGPSGKEFKYTGIDRVDNKVGYLYENCVSSCFECNRAKSTMTELEFVNHVKRIYGHLQVADLSL